MSWSSITLAETFPAQFDLAQGLVTKAQDGITEISSQEAKVQEMLTDANALVSSAQQALDNLAGSGIYTVALTSEQGSWSTRLASAPDAPAQSEIVYNAILASIFVGTDPTAIGSAYDSMKASLITPMRIEAPVLSPLESAVKLDEGSASWIPEDEWKSITVGDLFPAQLVSAKNAMNEAQKALTMAQNAKDALDARKEELEKALADAQAVVASMGATGIYTVMLAPALGNWLTRMTGEPSAPSTDASNYSAGTVTVIQAADLETVTAKWNQLIGAKG